MSEFGTTPFPRGPLVGATVLVVAVVLSTTGVRMTGVGASHTADAAAAVERDFKFEDRPDGSIAVIDPVSQAVVDTVPPGTNGFLRGTLRGLARERKREGLGPDVPFHLVGRVDGRLTLLDPATSRRVDLESFGPTNAAVFARILSLPQPSPTRRVVAPVAAAPMLSTLEPQPLAALTLSRGALHE